MPLRTLIAHEIAGPDSELIARAQVLELISRSSSSEARRESARASDCPSGSAACPRSSAKSSEAPTTVKENRHRQAKASYGISYTDREEEEPDPEKERRFAGAHAGWGYTEHINAATTFESDFGWNLSFADPTDYSFNTLNALTVSVTNRVSLEVSFQWLYENEPALESALDVIAFVEVVNPDGVPGSGDERFRTLESGGTTLVLGAADARKDRLDTIILTALVIKLGRTMGILSCPIRLLARIRTAWDVHLRYPRGEERICGLASIRIFDNSGKSCASWLRSNIRHRPVNGHWLS